ncbi:hypothetical protein EVJ58_g9985 [Rhodofomes roseus]|uniref:NAD(P)-dependent dehydrogenase (Short-subunit alcohol dehydrogenase family) n=1 Tax=Rhodofomes roseus TaxID=34475 RepID=A0A4Y9XQV9_9APHY|nr:hypothetical protein EVJ58_g9985 [Rhodofomes roseus]
MANPAAPRAGSDSSSSASSSRTHRTSSSRRAATPARASKLSALKDAAPGQLYVVALDVGERGEYPGKCRGGGGDPWVEGAGLPVQQRCDRAYLVTTPLDVAHRERQTEGDDSAFDFSYDGLLDTLRANVAGPALMGTVYLPLLEKGRRKVIVNMTSGLASIGLDFGAKNATYSISKTALNMLAYKQAKTRPDLIAYVVDPGWVKTAQPAWPSSTSPTMSTTVWLITGANRGLGLELTIQLLATNPANEIIATCRNPADADELHRLQKLANERIHIVPLDVSSEQSMRGSVQYVSDVLGERGIDYLYNNAAINPAFDSPFDFDYAQLLDVLQTNLGAPALLAELYYPFLLRGTKKTIVNVTTGLASIGLDCGDKCTSYSISKCALNMLVRLLPLDVSCPR